MKIKVIQACGIGGVSHAVGDKVDVDAATARLLIGIGKAEREPETIENPDPPVMTTAAAPELVRGRKRA